MVKKKYFKKLKRYDVIEDWLEDEGYDPEASTITNYRSNVRKFLVDFLKLKNPNKYPTLKRRKFEKDYRDYTKYLVEVVKLSGGAFKSHMAAINEFFEHYNLPYPRKWVKKFKRRRYGTTIQNAREEELLTSKKIKKLLSHGELIDNAFYSVMLSGGCRPDEIRSILLDDIKEVDVTEDVKMTRVYLRDAKGHIENIFVKNQ